MTLRWDARNRVGSAVSDWTARQFLVEYLVVAGGGGGGSQYGGNYWGGGAGGSGVVIISYAGSQQFTGGTVTSSGGNTIHTFTSSGSLVGAYAVDYLVVAGEILVEALS